METTPHKKKPGNPGKELSMDDRFPRTINSQLFDAWQILRRSGDPALLCKKTGFSRPIVDRALNYGHVKNPKLANMISEFFDKRLDKEKHRGDSLINAATS
jgi:hypothetical protein